MKKKILYFGLFFLSLSCTVENSKTIEESDFYGDWYLLSAEADREIDYNYDGETTKDIIEDFDCFTMELSLYPDNTFREVIIDRLVIDNRIECAISKRKGNWNYIEESNLIEFNYLDENNNIVYNVRSLFAIDRSKRFEFSREFTDHNGSFEANLIFSFIN